jgi:hypothetical protein
MLQNAMEWKFLAPDKPIRTTPEFLDIVDSTDWSIESKIDGFRIEVGMFNGKLHTISRHNINLDINKYLKNKLKKIIPDGCALDGEYINHSRIKIINKLYGSNLPEVECIAFHDVTWYNYKYNGKTPLVDRRNVDVFKNLVEMDLDNSIKNNGVFKIPMLCSGDPLNYFKSQSNYIISEGIVVKKKSGAIIGSSRDSVKNPSWFKIKYRN